MSQRCVTRRQYGDLSTSATAQLLLSCHARHTTVTGALSAAAALALAKVIDKSPLTNVRKTVRSVFSILDVRRRCDLLFRFSRAFTLQRDRVNGAIVGIIGRKVTVCLSYFADMRHHFWPPISPNCLCYNVSLMPPFKGTVDLVRNLILRFAFHLPAMSCWETLH